MLLYFVCTALCIASPSQTPLRPWFDLWRQMYLVILLFEIIQISGFVRGWCIKFATGLNDRFKTISSHFFANYIYLYLSQNWGSDGHFEVLILFGSKVMPQIQKMKKNEESAKNTKNIIQMSAFFTKLQQSEKGNICFLCHNFRTNYNSDLLSTSKWTSEPQFF